MGQGQRPDLVLVMTDQQRHDQIGYVGTTPVRTPTLDRLAADGVVFETAYSGSTTCVPARTALLTGLLDHRAPHVGPRRLDPGSFTVPHALRAAGYQTALVGKMHFEPIRTSYGFEHQRTVEHFSAYDRAVIDGGELDHYHDWLVARGHGDWRLDDRVGERTYPLPPETHPTSWVRSEALQFLEQRDPTRPMFLVVSFPHPHPPINPPEPYASAYDPAACEVDPDADRANGYLPSSFRTALAQEDAPHRRVRAERVGAVAQDLARTYGLITQIDDAVADVVAALDLDCTVLFFTSDHGDYAGHRGLVRKIPWIPFDDLSRVPFFVTGAGVAGGRRERGLVQSFDFATTCLDYAGVEVDRATLDGITLRPLLEDPRATAPEDRAVLSAVSEGWPMVRRGAHKYIRSGWGQEVLFDVERDPGEVFNLIALDEGRRIADELAAELERSTAGPAPDLPRFDLLGQR